MVVRVRALLRLAGVEVAAADADVVLVAGLELLDALDFVAVVGEDVVEALAVLVAFDGADGFGWGGLGAEVFDGGGGSLADDLIKIVS